MTQPSVYRTELTPISFLQRSAYIYPNKVAVIHGDRQITYHEFSHRVGKLIAALKAKGIRRQDRVAFLAPNIPALLEAHFAVPGAQGILVAINTRLQSEEIEYIVEHSGAKILFVDKQLHHLVESVD